jgi:hypothetical protein
MDEKIFTITSLNIGPLWKAVIDQEELLHNHPVLPAPHQIRDLEGMSFPFSNVGRINTDICLNAPQGRVIDFEAPVYVLTGETTSYEYNEDVIGKLKGFKEKGEFPKIIPRWQASARMSPSTLTEAELLRFSKAAGYEAIQDTTDIELQHSSQSIIENIHTSEKQSESDANYRAYLVEAERLGEECGECLVAYARGKRIALANNLTELLARIPEEYDEDDILIQRIPPPSFSIRPPIRVLD